MRPGAALHSVGAKEQADSQPPRVLTFSPADALDLGAVVLNTEAHALRRTW